MKDVLGIVSITLFFVVGLICFTMAYKNLFGARFLPFHEQASGSRWEDLKTGVQDTILTLLQVSGLGFLVVALLLAVVPVIGYFRHDIVLVILVPAIAIIFCFGLFLFNYRLYRKTKADTPWQASLLALAIVAFSMVLSLLSL